MIIPETTVGRIGPWRLGVGATFQDDAYVDASDKARRGPTALISVMREGAGPDAERQVTVGAGAEIVLDDTARVRIVRVGAGEEGFVEVQELR